MRVNIAELAEILDTTRPTITAWTNAGMPYAVAGSKGRPWQYDVFPCLEWWAENKFRHKPKKANPQDPFAELGEQEETIDEAERRKMVANADKAELDLSKAASRVVPIEEVAAVVAEENARVRSRLLGIPNEVRMKVRPFCDGDRQMEESIVGGVEETILDAMTEIRDPAEITLGSDDRD